MQKTKFIRVLSVILCVVLIAAAALFTSGCTDKKTIEMPAENAGQTQSVTELGEGSKTFSFTVTDADSTETAFLIHTDKTMVGEALQELGLLEGEEGPYGLYVKTVNSVTYDYDTHGKYWAFYINGEMAMSGVDTTDVVEGTTYSFVATKA